MGKKTIWMGYDKKLKKTQYENLTYDFFAEHLGYEYCFSYKDKVIDLACHKENDKTIYELNINNPSSYGINGEHFDFDSPEELLEKGLIDGKTIKEIWDELEN